jgi:hypothetical protein
MSETLKNRRKFNKKSNGVSYPSRMAVNGCARDIGADLAQPVQEVF